MPFHEKVGDETRVGAAGPPVMFGAGGTVGSMVSVWRFDGRELPATS